LPANSASLSDSSGAPVLHGPLWPLAIATLLPLPLVVLGLWDGRDIIAIYWAEAVILLLFTVPQVLWLQVQPVAWTLVAGALAALFLAWVAEWVPQPFLARAWPAVIPLVLVHGFDAFRAWPKRLADRQAGSDDLIVVLARRVAALVFLEIAGGVLLALFRANNPLAVSILLTLAFVAVRLYVEVYAVRRDRKAHAETGTKAE
jgi:Family of unknown function (DUF6498)